MVAPCWICRNPGNTGEHLAKRSDIKMLLGKRGPYYVHTAAARNRLAQGLNSNVLKSSAPLCAECNNEHTQPYDRAWEMLSAYMYQRTRSKKVHRVDIKDVFPASRLTPGVGTRKMASRAQLYLVKSLGTRLAEDYPAHQLLPTFAEALRSGYAHPDIYVAIKLDTKAHKTAAAAGTDVHAVVRDGQIEFLTWGYSIERLFYQLYFAKDRSKIRGGAWHPQDPGRFIPVKQGYG